MLSFISALDHVPLRMDRTWLYLSPVETAVDPQRLQASCVVIQLAISRSRRVSVVLNFMAVLLTQRCLVVGKSFGKFFGWLRDICILAKACSFASWQMLTYITHLNVLPKWNYLSNTETNDKRWQVEPVEVQNLMQTSANVCEVFAFKFASFLLSTKSFRVICRSCKYFYHLQRNQLSLCFSYLRA